MDQGSLKSITRSSTVEFPRIAIHGEEDTLCE